jgi:hypothetical protein
MDVDFEAKAPIIRSDSHALPFLKAITGPVGSKEFSSESALKID